MKTTIRGLLMFAAVTLAVPSFAQTLAREYNLQIERQPLASALTEFSKQTGLQIGYFPETLSESIYIGPLSGRYTADSAIAQLLLPSGLSFERLNERTIAVTGSELTKSQSYRFSTMERKTGDDDSSAPSFVRLAHLRLAQGPAAEEDLQKSRTAEENARRSGRKSPLTLEEIVVTAQKREERLQDVPISISVLTGDDLDRATVRDVTEALSRVPGVALTESFLGGFSTVNVRGVNGGLFDSGASPTAYYIDGMPFGFASDGVLPDPDVYDLERIEVLRGPQGTLYGANALSGVVRVLTQDPNLNKFELKARGLTSTTELGGENFRGDLAVNVPLIEGKLAARAAVGYQDLSGWIDRPLQKDANDAERRTMRLKVNAQPTEALSIGLSAWLSRADYGAPSTGFEPGQSSRLGDEPMSTDYDAYGLKIGYDFPGVSVTSMTSYLDYATAYHLGRGVVLDGILDATTFAQEIYLASTQEGSWRWTAGGMYRDAEDRDGGTLLPLTPELQITRTTSKSYAVFGELTRRLLDGQVEVTAGLRYFEDEVTMHEDGRWLFGAPLDPPLTVFGATFSATTPRVVLAWHPQEQLTVYTSYSEGFRSGWAQNPSVLTVAPYPPVEPDHLTNYELGAKGSLGRRLHFEAALYFIEWRDMQSALGVEILPGLFQGAGVNVDGSASGVGVDFAVTAAPVDRLELGASVSWNDLRLDDDIIDGLGAVVNRQGERFSGSSEYTLGASADYVFPLGGNGFAGQVSASANYTSEQVGQSLVAGVWETFGGDPILISRASVSIRAPARWTASLFVDNLNNERGSPVRISRTNRDLDVRVRPRTVGVQFEYRY